MSNYEAGAGDKALWRALTADGAHEPQFSIQQVLELAQLKLGQVEVTNWPVPSTEVVATIKGSPVVELAGIPVVALKDNHVQVSGPVGIQGEVIIKNPVFTLSGPVDLVDRTFDLKDPTVDVRSLPPIQGSVAVTSLPVVEVQGTVDIGALPTVEVAQTAPWKMHEIENVSVQVIEAGVAESQVLDNPLHRRGIFVLGGIGSAKVEGLCGDVPFLLGALDAEHQSLTIDPLPDKVVVTPSGAVTVGCCLCR